MGLQNIKIDAEFRDLIPPLTSEEYEGLKESIVKDGCRDALVVWNDTLIDGHNRYAICTEYGIPFETVQKDFETRNDAMVWIIKNQFGRRNLPAYERGRLALRLKPVIAERARENQAVFYGNQYESGLLVNLPKVQPTHTSEELAKVAGIGEKTIRMVEKIEQLATPEIKRQVASGEISINQAYQTVRREEKRADVQQRIEEHAKDQTGVIDLETVKKKYNIIYADPPWQYWESGNKNQANHYTTMSIEDICALPVKEIADENCLLFMWVTYPILQEAFKVIEAWGFKYSTCAFVWVKKNKNVDTPFVGCGAWTRANSELCLLATKGSMTRMDASVSQIIESPIEEHSKKPDCTRERIENLVGKLPRVELFCRHPADGWDVWGNEA